MREASEYLVGVHDFRNFCKMDVGNGVVEFVRNIQSVHIAAVEGNDLNEVGKLKLFYHFYFKLWGTNFLFKMICRI